MVTLFLTASALLVLSSLYMLIPLVNTLSSALHSTWLLTSYVNTGFSLFYALGFLFVGAIAPKYGSKKVIVSGLFVLAAVTLGAGFAGSIETLIALRALQGFAASAFGPTALIYIAENYRPRERIVVMSWITTGFISAGVVGQIISSALEPYWGWRGVFQVMGIAYLLLSVLGGKLLAATPPPCSPKGESIAAALRRLVANTSLAKAYVVAFVLLLSFVALYSSLGDYLAFRFAMSRQEIFSIRASGILGVAGAPLVPRLAARFSVKRLICLGLSVMIAGLLFMSFTASATLTQAALVIFVAGLLMTIPGIITLISQLAGDDRGPALTWYSFILFVGAGAGPLVANGGDFLTVTGILIGFLSIALGTASRIKSP